MNSLYDCKPIHRHTWYSPTGFTKIIDYIHAEWHIKKLCSNCRVYRGASSIPFETNHQLLALSCSFPSKRKQKSFFHKPSKPPRIHTNIKSLKDNSNICDNYSKRLSLLVKNAPKHPVQETNAYEFVVCSSSFKAYCYRYC